MKMQSYRKIARVFAVALLLFAPLALAAGNAVDTVSAGNQQSPDVARTTSGAAVIVWASSADRTDLTEVRARRYDAQGNPVGAPFQVNQVTRLRQYMPRVGMAADGSFLVAWLSEVDAPSIQIRGRRYAADGTPEGPEFRIDTPSGADITVDLAVGMNAAGEGVVAWARRRTVGGLASLDLRSIRGRQIGPDGQLGREINVTSTPLPVLRAPSVGVAPNGDFVIAWHTDSDIPSSAGIFARRYRPNGRSYRPFARRVSTRGADVVAYDTPRVTYGPNGNYTVAWTGYAADSSPVSVFLRRFNRGDRPLDDGTQVGEGLTQPAIAIDGNNELSLVAVSDGRIVLRRFDAEGNADDARVVEASRPFQVLAPDIDVDTDGRGLIAWQDFGRDGDGRGVYASTAIPGDTATGDGNN